MADCKKFKNFRFIMHSIFEYRSILHFTAEKCDKCGNIIPKKPDPIPEPRTPTKSAEKFEQCSPSKGSPFKRLGSFLRGKSKDDSSSKK